LLAEAPERLQHLDLLFFHFALILMHISNHEAIEILIKSPYFFKFYKGEYHIRSAFKYGDYRGKRGAGMLLTSIQGFIDLEYPDYKGPKALGNLEKNLIHFSTLPGEINHEDFAEESMYYTPPQVGYSYPPDIDEAMKEDGIEGVDGVDDGEEEDKIPKHTYRYVMHKMFRRILYGLYGTEKVCETMVLPHLGIIGHVMIIDKNGTPINIPQQFQNLKATELKIADPELGTWIFIFKLPKNRNYHHAMRIGGVSGVHRLLRKVGFKPVILESDELNIMERGYRSDEGDNVTVIQVPQLLSTYKQYIDGVLQQHFLSLKQ